MLDHIRLFDFINVSEWISVFLSPSISVCLPPKWRFLQWAFWPPRWREGRGYEATASFKQLDGKVSGDAAFYTNLTFIIIFIKQQRAQTWKRTDWCWTLFSLALHPLVTSCLQRKLGLYFCVFSVICVKCVGVFMCMCECVWPGAQTFTLNVKFHFYSV